MELKLNIYDKKQVVKTYTAETYDIMFGTVEDLLDVIDLDHLKTGNDAEFVKMIADAVVKGFDLIKPLLKDIFDGLTDDELRNAKVKEIALVILNVIKFTGAQIMRGSKGKN